MIKKISLFLALLMSISLFSQKTTLDKYQYIIVSDKFDYLKKVDEYQTSSLTKFLLKKKGFKVFLSNEKLPKELIENRCLSLFAAVKDESSMFSTKSSIEIKDCYNKILYTSETGKSKFKEYKKAYQEAIRRAFDSMEDFEYSYNSNSIIEQKEDLNLVKVIPKVVVIPEVIKQTEKKEGFATKSVTILHAQSIINGFQLVNTKPEVVFSILKTNVKDVYIIKNKNGVFYKIGEKWVAEYYKENILIQEEYQIKF